MAKHIVRLEQSNNLMALSKIQSIFSQMIKALINKKKRC